MGSSDLLFGRWTYESFSAFWPNQTDPNPFTEVLNQTQKYVASTTLTEPLPWMNSTLLSGDAADAVAELKTQPGNDIAVLASGQLVRLLIDPDLVDEYTLLIHPLVLGSGQRLFREGTRPAELGWTIR
jgi:dihydrofolate reductase